MKYDLLKECVGTLRVLRARMHKELDASITAELDDVIRLADDFGDYGEIGLSLGMVPIVTHKEIMGFSFNRIWRAVKREAARHQ